MTESEGGGFASESDDDQDEYNFATDFAYNVGSYAARCRVHVARWNASYTRR